VEKLYSVQYLRGLAALLVVVAHAFSHQIGLENPLVVFAGQMGVVLFFVISGFIMVYISGTGTFSAWNFLTRRAARIVPLYWLFTGLAALLALVLPSLFKTTTFTWPHLIQSLLFIVHEAPGRGGSSPLLSLGWTLNYEAYFYVAFAALAVFSATLRLSILSVVFIGLWLWGALLPSSDPVVQFYLNLSPLAFALGSWVGLAALHGWHRKRAWMVAVLSAVGLGGLWLALANMTNLDPTPGFMGQMALGASLLVLGLMSEGERMRSRALALLGDASYAIYLTHMFVIGAALGLLERLVPLDNAASVIAAALGTVVLALLVGILTHYWIEKPLLALVQGRRKARIAGAGTAVQNAS